MLYFTHATPHPSDVFAYGREAFDLELYQLGRMTDAQIAGIDLHLSECIDCSHRMLAIDRFVKLLRAGVIRAGSKSYDHFVIPTQDFRRY